MAVDGRRGRRVPLGLVGALALVAGAEWGVFRRLDGLTPYIPASWSQSGRAARREAVAADVLCLGDSQVKSGLLPNVLARRLGRPAYNLAVVGGQPASAYYLLARALKAGARPR